MPAVSNSYSIDSGATLFAGRDEALPPWILPTCYQGGDSITADDVWTPHRRHLGRQGAPFKVVANLGFNGLSVQGYRDQLRDNAWNLESAAGLVGAPKVGAFFNRVGSNNARGGASITNTEKGLYRDITDRSLAKSQRCIWLGIPPIGGVVATARPNVNGWNDFLASLPSEYPGLVHYVDDVSGLKDVDGNIIKKCYDPGDNEEVHPDGYGQFVMTNTAEAAYTRLLSKMNKVSPLVPSTPGNIIVNSAMSGTAGTVGSGWTGTVIDGGAVSSVGSGVGGTVSVVSSGDSIPYPWQRITPTSFGANTSVQLALTCNPVTFSSIYPARVEHIFQIRFNAVDGTKIHRVRFFWIAGGQIISGESWIKVNGDTGITETLTYRSIRPRASTSSGVSGTLTPTAYFLITSVGGGSGSMGSIDVRCPVLLIES